MSKRIRSVNCCNPFNESRVKDLRKFPDEDRWKFPDLDDTSMLCVRCRFRVKDYIPPASEEEEITSSQISVESLSISAEISTQGSSYLELLYSEKNYGVKKLDESNAALENKFQSQFRIVPESTYRKINQDHCSMIAKVKKLYNAESDKSIKNKLLSILPDSWEVSRIASEFNCSQKWY
ncbi:Protein of unknown function [Cotesia congregata]|uniref:Uncharacterized protein n=1 Tax=Cotesia congregata TaxID=51543 RepID=A0A8J2HSX7_COTCN|nr:Protein of unknown function [Cotesia congregata]